ncbi:MAG TPA: CapA family protein [Gemmatimonadales bacterium]
MRQERLALAAHRLRDGEDVMELQPGPATATIAAVGDIGLRSFSPDHPGRISAAAASVRDVLGEADMVTGNLESVLSSREEPAGRLGTFLRGVPEAIEIVAAGGLDVVTCANNHCLDFGAEALIESVDALRRTGVEVCGVGDTPLNARQPVRRTVNGLRIGVLAYADDWRPQAASDYGPAGTVDSEIFADIRELRPLVDVVILHLHWGWEWVLHPLRSHRDRARRFAEAGADLVLCHHAHVPMAVESWGRSVIAHGLGNFLFPPADDRVRTPPHFWRDRSYVLHVGVSASGVHSARITPVEYSDGRVLRSAGGRRREILGGLASLRQGLDDEHRLLTLELDRTIREGRDLARRLLVFAEAGDREMLGESVSYLHTPRSAELVASLGRVPDGTGVALAGLLDVAAAEGVSAVEGCARDGRLRGALETLLRSEHLSWCQPGRTP